MFAHSAILSIPVNKKCWIQPVVLINFVVNTVCNKAFLQTNLFRKSASSRRFFVCVANFVFSTFHCLPVTADPSFSCQIEEPDRYVQVDHVIDGDTFVLRGGERLRLIGIDTPEIGRQGAPSQALAIAARKFVTGLLASRSTYGISYGRERKDHHGRTLAHFFLEDGRNLQTLILARGYATLLNIPPNLSFSHCYRNTVNTAIQARKGLWNLEQYQPRAVSSLTSKDRGYAVVYGQITRIAKSSSSTSIELDQALTIRIKKIDLKHFQELSLTDLRRRKIQVSGKLYSRNKQLQMRLRHPSDLQILNN